MKGPIEMKVRKDRPAKRSGGNELLNAAWECPDVKGTEKLLLVCLADLSRKNGVCNPGLPFLGRRLGCTPRYVVSLISALEGKGLVFVERRSGRPNTYTVKLYKSVASSSELQFTGEAPFTGEPQFTQPVNNSSKTREPQFTHNHSNRKRTIPPPPHGGKSESFELFWNAWPKKVAKKAALRAWNRLKPKNGLVGTILADVKKRRESPEWTKDKGQFIPHPSTYINGRRWEDEESESQEFTPDEIEAARRKNEDLLKKHVRD